MPAKHGLMSWASELALVCRLGVPSSIANVAMGTQLAIGLIVSPLGEDAIAGAGIGVMWQNVTAVSVFVGIQYGFGALCAQAFGSKNYRRVGVLLQRTLLIQLVLCIPMGALWYWTEEILLSLGQPAVVSHYAGVFVRTQLISLPFQGLYQALATFLRSQMHVTIVMLLSVPTAVCMVVLAKVLVDEDLAGFGFVGAPMALAIGGVFQSAALLWLAPKQLSEPTWVAWSVEAAQGWPELIRIALGASIGLWAEWWAGELQVLLSGLLCGTFASGATHVGPSEVGGGQQALVERDSAECQEMTVTVMLRNIGTLHFVMLGGFSTAVPIRVGNLLGSGDADGAKFAATVGGVMQTVAGLCFASVVCLMGLQWAAWFHLTASGTELLLTLLPLAFSLYAGISIGCFALRSICNGMALVRVPALVQLVSFYPVGLLLGGVLAMRGALLNPARRVRQVLAPCRFASSATVHATRACMCGCVRSLSVHTTAARDRRPVSRALAVGD